MKVLLVGEGPHDVGHQGDAAVGEPQRVGGVVATLARRACSAIGEESIALRWKDVSRFSHSQPPGRGLAEACPAGFAPFLRMLREQFSGG